MTCAITKPVKIVMKYMMNKEKLQVRGQLQGGDLYDMTATFHILVWIL